MKTVDQDISASKLDWPSAKKLLAAGLACWPEIFEAHEADGGGWEIVIDIREPGHFEPFREGLRILASTGASESKKWPTLEAARKAIRSALPVDSREGVTVHSLRC